MSTAKAKIEQLRANVEAQESRLEEGIKMLNAARKKGPPKAPTPASYSPQTNQPSEWDPLERVIGLMDDLLTSYRKYSAELEKKVTKFGAKAESRKPQK
ncbi:MAG: hypothetical protein PXY39_05405 [archaeon]|jgi:hypothetical protein|nr:hypothetical protein [archaeon]